MVKNIKLFVMRQWRWVDGIIFSLRLKWLAYRHGGYDNIPPAVLHNAFSIDTTATRLTMRLTTALDTLSDILNQDMLEWELAKDLHRMMHGYPVNKGRDTLVEELIYTPQIRERILVVLQQDGDLTEQRIAFFLPKIEQWLEAETPVPTR